MQVTRTLRTTGRRERTGSPRRGVRGGAVRGVTAAGRRGPRLRWRPLPGNLTDRRGAALAPPILLAVALNVAAVAGLAGIARLPRRLCLADQDSVAVAVRGGRPALAMSAAGDDVAYRSIYAAEDGYQLSRRQLTAMVAAGFSGLFSTGGMRPGRAGSPGQRR